MLLLVLAALTATAGPPPGLDLDDPTPWEERYTTLRDGPAGCWDFAGDLTVTATVNTAPDLFSLGGKKSFVFDGTFEGRLVDGTWTRFVQRIKDPDGEGYVRLGVRTLVGRLDEAIIEAPDVPPCTGETQQSVSLSGKGGLRANELICAEQDASTDLPSELSPDNILRKAIDDWTSVGTSAVDWSEQDQAVRLFLDAAMIGELEGYNLSVVARFPNGGPHPTSITATWPKTVRVGDRPMRVTLKDTQAHLRGAVVGETLLPTIESLSLVASVLGFTGGYEQRVTYRTAKRCVETAAPTSDPAVEAPTATPAPPSPAAP